MKCYGTKIIINHINVVTKPPRTMTLFYFFKKYFLRIANLYICIVSENTRNAYVKYSNLDLSTLKFNYV